jgi:epidermal growth factor receptor substrate 15
MVSHLTWTLIFADSRIRDLADMDNNGRLTRDGFAVAFHLIQSKLAGKDLPATLPPTLIPPTKRGAASAFTPSQPPVPEAVKDLLWDDSPPQSAVSPPPTLQPQRTGAISPQHTAQTLQPAHVPTSIFGATDPFGGAPSVFANAASPFSAPIGRSLHSLYRAKTFLTVV